MGAKPNSHPELTSTIHLSQLRAVPQAGERSDLWQKLSSEEQDIISGLLPDSAMLLGATGPSKGFRFLLDSEETYIGRDDSNQIVLDDVTVSRKHALIKRTVAGFSLLDLKSLNGSYVNGKVAEDLVLQQFDEIQIGKYKFIFFEGKVIE